jgi:hypothetical protein
MTTTTKFAIAAVASALMGTSALAADLGGSCCADLEERIAELEATTVRKGNRKVSVQISGFVGHNVMFWDDGVRSDMYIGDGGNIFSRWRLRGSAKISADWSAGFLYEFGVHRNNIGNMNQQMGQDEVNGDDLGGSATGFGLLRDSTVWLRHNRLGMVKVGHGSTATDNLVLIDLGGKSAASTPDVPLYIGAFRLVRNGAISGTPASGIGAATWANVFLGGETWDTTRRNHVLYETPSLHGFTLQAAVAEDNYWDVALRYAGEFNGFRIAFGIGYQENTEFNHGQTPVFPDDPLNSTCGPAANCSQKETQLKGSASILHVPTGLFVTAAAGEREITDRTSLGALNRDATSDFWYISGGVARNFFGIGNTVLFGEYGEAGDSLRHVSSDVTASTGSHWGIGITQHIDAAAMEVFATYKQFEADVTLVGNEKVTGLEELSIFLAGVRINF